ncbi:cobalamin-binding protein [candidate division NPL-UPA2 bacterium]|nr:cobalamin-binding protein [candidate division NPL-UPA2 bacterium]
MKIKGTRVLILILSILLLPILQARGESPQRIVSLAPAYTEVLVELGLGDRLVGVTPFCDYLEEARDIEKVGFTQPSLEKIVSLRPDLVLVADYIGQASISKALERLGIKVVIFRHRGVKGIFEMVEEIGRLCGKEEEARKLLKEMEEVIDEVRRKVRGLERPRVYVEIGYNPLFTAGKGSHIDDLIEIVGGENIAKGIDKPYPRISQEFIIEKDPQVIILPYMGRHYTKESVKKRSGWENISAVRNNRIYDDIGTQAITIPSPNLILKGLPELAKRIHPEIK